MAFIEWLKQQTKRIGPIGAIAKDVFRDPKYSGKTVVGLYEHMEKFNACEEAFDALEEALIEYNHHIGDSKGNKL